MKVILCLDDRNGLAFNHRRQSRDQEVCRRIAAMTKKNRLYMTEYSRKLFQQWECENIVVTVDFCQAFSEGGPEDFCFMETERPGPYMEDVTELILFKWNRLYPADLKLDIELEQYKRMEKDEFAGYSHEKISVERYKICQRR